MEHAPLWPPPWFGIFSEGRHWCPRHCPIQAEEGHQDSSRHWCERLPSQSRATCGECWSDGLEGNRAWFVQPGGQNQNLPRQQQTSQAINESREAPGKSGQSSTGYGRLDLPSGCSWSPLGYCTDVNCVILRRRLGLLNPRMRSLRSQPKACGASWSLPKGRCWGRSIHEWVSSCREDGPAGLCSCKHCGFQSPLTGCPGVT